MMKQEWLSLPNSCHSRLEDYLVGCNSRILYTLEPSNPWPLEPFSPIELEKKP